MRYEYVSYWSVKDHNEFLRIKASLPEDVKAEFIRDKRLNDDPWLEAHKDTVIAYLDRVFHIGESLDFEKRYHLEIDRKEIGHFSHFRIGPKDVEVERDFFVDVSRPLCSVDGCFAASEILGPVKIKVKRARNIGIAQLGRAWGKPVELLISAELKGIFESQGVTGLSYEPVKFLDKDEYDDIPFDRPYLARLTNSIYVAADDVVLHRVLCEVHRTTYFKYIHNARIPRESMLPDDFLALCGVRVRDQTYNYHVDKFIVTRKVLEILLDSKIEGLSDIGFFIKTKFEPCLLIK
jgi:hypothetical protein